MEAELTGRAGIKIFTYSCDSLRGRKDRKAGNHKSFDSHNSRCRAFHT